MLQAHPFSGINRKVQLKPTAWEVDERGVERVSEAQFILAGGRRAHRSGQVAGARSRPHHEAALAAPPQAAPPLRTLRAVRRARETTRHAPLLGPHPHPLPAAAAAATATHSPNPLLTPPPPHPHPRAHRNPPRRHRRPPSALCATHRRRPRREQAATLGTYFRNALYPSDLGGVLRLHSTYRHDLKIYSSDEGRVQMTAAAFAKGFLDLEGNLTPILASLVSKHKSITAMLDDTPEL